jgi:predicted metal-dependent hydrolase
MPKANPVKTGALNSINLGGRKVDYRLVHSPSARKLRVRVGLAGVEVVQPKAREAEEVETFLLSHGKWIVGQLKRVERFRSVRKPQRGGMGEILYKGVPTWVQVEDIARRQRTNRVVFEQGRLMVVRGRVSRTPPAKSLENWLRR